ncbi:hypothetical protein ABMA28_003612 [Loxostege sticticalis]|uniref:Uncharacterized protein n=1 Tax=Loxostege sticticalis TaxID=481309 RepID=A0ABD0T0Y5_LOXSC
MTLVLMADARPEPMPLLPCRPQVLREGEHHIVKKSRALGTRIGFGSGPDPNTYWNF